MKWIQMDKIVTLLLSCSILLANPSLCDAGMGRYGWNSRRSISPQHQQADNQRSIVLMSSTTSNDVCVPTATATATTVVSTSSEPPKSNPIVQLGNYVKDSVIRLKNGTGQLYTNHKICNTIRTKQKQYIQENPKSDSEQYQKTGLSFQEYDFLNKGKEDRGKVLNMGFMMFFSPNFLPYAFMFFPNFLPSPFQQSLPIDLNKWETISRERAHAVVATLMDIEKEAKSIPKSNPLIPFVGKGKALKKRERMGQVYQMAGQLLLFGADASKNPNKRNTHLVNGENSSSPNGNGEEHLLKTLQSEIFTEMEPDRSRKRLSFVPKSIVKGLALAIDGNTISPQGTSGANRSFLSGLTPFFFIRNKVLTHLNVVNEADNFLVYEDIDLGTLDGELLVDVCHARMIGTPESSVQDLRNALNKWLDLTVRRPESLLSTSSSSPTPVSAESYNGSVSNAVVATSSDTASASVVTNAVNTNPHAAIPQIKMTSTMDSSSSTENITTKYYNANLAKFALMCYNAVDGARDTGSASALCRFLFH